MRLRSLRIDRLPGIEQGFELDGLDPGLNVVLGPNASGKTSVIRALRAALYEQELPGTGVSVTAEFEDEVGVLTVTRLGTTATWMRSGGHTEPPPLPDHRFLRCYVLEVEDLLGGSGTDREVAERLARELAGGYDLGSVRDGDRFGIKKNHGRPEEKGLREAERHLQSVRDSRAALQRSEAELGRLREERKRAEEAGRATEAYERALELIKARRDRRGLEDRAAEFPEGMERLHGNEVQRLRSLRDKMSDTKESLAKAVAAEEEAKKKLDQTGLADEDVDEAVIAEQRRLLERLKESENALRDLESRRAEAQANLDATTGDLGGEPGANTPITPEAVRNAEDMLAEKRRLDAELGALDRELELLPEGPGPGEHAEQDALRIRAARAELQRWLSAPGEDGGGPRRTAVAVLVLVALATAAAAAVAVHPGFAVGGLAALAAGWLALRGQGDRAALRAEAQRRFAETGLAEPQSWEEASVRAHLEEMDRRLVEAERQEVDAARRAELERLRKARRKKLDPVVSALAEAARGLGFDPSRLDASFERWVRLVRDHDRARESLRGAEANRVERSEEAEKLRQEVQAFLRRFGQMPEAAQADAEILSTRVDAFEGRVRARDAARRDLDAARKEIGRLEKALEELKGDIGEIFREAHVEGGDEAALARRVQRLDEWRDHQRSLEQARWKERELAQHLEPELLHLAEQEDEGSLRRTLEELRTRAAGRDDIAERITSIETLADKARGERALEQALADRQAAEDLLRDRRDEALYAEAGRFLLDAVDEEHVAHARPAALRRAEEWFRLFTRHQYELTFTPGNGGFSALETATQATRGLSELSSGTRMQLLLAVRIAFALEAEQGRVSLPLFLDEALTTADPDRFEAVADALALLAEADGRQVFYLTAQPQDVAYWGVPEGRATCIDIARVRRRAAALPDPRELELPARPQIPRPEEFGALEEYAVALGVPPVDPWEDAAAVHLFHVLRDRPELLHRLLVRGVEKVGHLDSLLGAEGCSAVLGEDERQFLQRRVSAVAVWIEAWREGRGRPVDRTALEESGAVTDTFIDRVADLNERVGGDAELLLERLAAREVDRFHAQKREELADYLEQNGFLGDGEVCTEVEIELRVQSSLSGQSTSPEEDFEEARSLVAALRQGMREGVR